MKEITFNVAFDIETHKITTDGVFTDYVGFAHGSTMNGVLTFKGNHHVPFVTPNYPYTYIDLDFIWPRSFTARSNSKFIVGCGGFLNGTSFGDFMSNQFFATIDNGRMKGTITTSDLVPRHDDKTSYINLVKLDFDIVVNDSLDFILK